MALTDWQYWTWVILGGIGSAVYFDYIAQGQSLALVRYAARRTLDSSGWYIVGVVKSAGFWNAAIDTVTFLLPLHLTALHTIAFPGKIYG